MKIISKFKDYYDHLAHIYGRDSSIVYKRLEFGFEFGQSVLTKTALPRLPMKYGNREYNWLVFCGKLYVVIPVGPGNYPVKKYKLIPFEDVEMPRFYEWTDPVGLVDPGAVELCKTLKAPVFIVTTDYFSNHVKNLVPNLGQIGFGSIMPPEQAFQEISYFLGNTIKESPDASPVPKITDKEKILTHGFDLVQSFRKRV